jgi:hypothetical protein
MYRLGYFFSTPANRAPAPGIVLGHGQDMGREQEEGIAGLGIEEGIQ